MPSGHSAIAFCLATTIAFVSDGQPLAVSLSYLLALIVAQSRVDSNVHSILEVVVGGIFGTLLTIIMFRIFA
jgi:diacylglycerol kinase (ATP)